MLGESVGSYLILRVLGEGGMGRVYVAEHQVIGKRAAIKVLLPQYSANPEIVNRFFTEARASSLLKHPGVVDIYDFGRLADGRAYLVMEFLEGENLGARLQRAERLPLDLALDVTRQVANALSAAHARGIVHRDLKPDNVFLVPDAELRSGVRAKVLDFGIAKLTDENSSSPSGKTRTGAIIGTPTYMSPEQCRGAGRVDHRCDIYSLGCVLFEMVTGHPPFAGEGPGDVIAAHLFQPLPSLSGIVPAPMESVMQRLLAKSPEARFQSMSEVVAAIGALGEQSQRRSEAIATVRMASVDVPVAASPVSPSPPHVTTPAPRATTPAPRVTTPLPAPRVTTPAPAPPVGGRRITTLGGATGEVQRAARGGAGIGRRVVVATSAALGVIAATVVILHFSSRAPASAIAVEPPPLPAPSPSPPPAGQPSASPESAPAAAPARVTLSLVSQPPGADVYREADGVRVGRTPWQSSFKRSTDEAVFRVRAKGYREATISMPLDKDGAETIVLERVQHKPVIEKHPADVKPIKNGVVDPFAD